MTAAKRPVLVVPSMNEAMYRSAAVQRNLDLLREDGHYLMSPGTGHEVAWAPSARTPMLGAAPPPAHVVSAVELLLQNAGERRSVAPASPEGWNQQYEAGAVSALPWFTEELDADIAEELRAMGKGRLLDVGTGPGTTAIFAARNGFSVVATDLSPAALAIARGRADDLAIVWMLDDALQSRLWGPFDVVVDRGCFHCLPKAAWPKYAEALGQWVARDGRVILKLHSPEEAGRHGTHPASKHELREVFAPHFRVLSVRRSTFEGTVRPAPKAFLAILARSEN